MAKVENQTALVIGGTGRIGLAISKKLLVCGVKTIICGRKDFDRTEISNGIECYYMRYDLSDITNHENCIRRAISLYGKLDYIVFSVGIHQSSQFLNVCKKEFDEAVDIGIKGIFFSMQAILRVMKEQKTTCRCLIVNSFACEKPAITPNQLNKWALKGFVAGVAAEMNKYGIKVNAIEPHHIVDDIPCDGESNIGDVCDLVIKLLLEDEGENGESYIC